MEYTVLSLPFVFFRGFVYSLCQKWSLYLFSSHSNTSLLFFPPVLINSNIDFTLLVACSAHLLTLLWIHLVFIAMNPSSLAAVACSISSSASRYNRNKSLECACSWGSYKAHTWILHVYSNVVARFYKGSGIFRYILNNYKSRMFQRREIWHA